MSSPTQSEVRPATASQPAASDGVIIEARDLVKIYPGASGNVLTNATLTAIRAAAQGFAGPITVYGEASRLGSARLKEENVTFKQTPYDVKAR